MTLTSLGRYGWRWAFLLQLPLFALSLVLTTVNLHYPTPVSTRLVELLDLG